MCYVPLLQHDHSISGRPFLALHDFEFHFLTFGQRAEPIAADSAVMNKNITVALALNEAESFGFIEPLDGSIFAICQEQTTSR